MFALMRLFATVRGFELIKGCSIGLPRSITSGTSQDVVKGNGTFIVDQTSIFV